MKNFFDLFALPQKFALDLEALEKKYLELQSLFHPDKSSSDDISKSIEINEGYKILADDFLRACHLLQLKNVDILNDEKAANVDIATLQEVLDLQEKIFEISGADEIRNLQNQLNLKIRLLLLEFVKHFEAPEIKEATQILIKVKYLKKSLQDLKIRKQKI